ncbi:MAG: DUF2188 domain-containing protein [Proteobacteria bacterium]|nr:DUF2188 domain-containing protein [Pseudomonadota bacterium]
MAKPRNPPLPRFEVAYDPQKDDWALTSQSGRVVKREPTKGELLDGGLGQYISTGTVRIHKEDGKFQEERTFPRSRDPKKSPG